MGAGVSQARGEFGVKAAAGDEFGRIWWKHSASDAICFRNNNIVYNIETRMAKLIEIGIIYNVYTAGVHLYL